MKIVKEDRIIAGYYMDEEHNEIIGEVPIEEPIIKPKKIKPKLFPLGKQYKKTLNRLKVSMDKVTKND